MPVHPGVRGPGEVRFQGPAGLPSSAAEEAPGPEAGGGVGHAVQQGGKGDPLHTDG